MTPTLSEGTKYDSDKLRYDLIPPGALEELAKLYTFGAKKYDARNWQKGIKFSRVLAAMQRHIELFRQGETCDKEHKMNHMASVAWGAFALIEFCKHLPEFDDRAECLEYGVPGPVPSALETVEFFV